MILPWACSSDPFSHAREERLDDPERDRWPVEREPDAPDRRDPEPLRLEAPARELELLAVLPADVLPPDALLARPFEPALS